MDETAKVIGAPVVPGGNDVDRGIVNGLTGLVKRAGAISQSIADRFDIAPSDLLALFKLD